MNNKTLDGQALEIIQNKLNEVQTKLRHLDYLDNYVSETLESFAYRYLADPRVPEQVNKNTIRVFAIEKGIKEAIKIKNAELRRGIGELVKRVSKEQGPTILREIKVINERNTNHGGTCRVSARISFGHPDHEFNKGSFVENLSTFEFVDEIHFRNTLAKHLDVVCDLF